MQHFPIHHPGILNQENREPKKSQDENAAQGEERKELKILMKMRIIIKKGCDW